MALAMALGLPGLILRVSGTHLAPELTALVSGIGIVGAAFVISWACEVAQLDISASLAIAILALIAILPEYSVEFVLAWDAGEVWQTGTTLGNASEGVKDVVGRAAANVTGANRLLIGLGWSMVVLVFWLKRRRHLTLERGLSLELTILTVATLLTFLLFFLKEVALYMAGILIALYLFYLWSSSRHGAEEPELLGPSAAVGSLPKVGRRALVLFMFAYSAIIIFAAAEPFVDGLVETGGKIGIDEFILIQWLAPLASEAPEMVIALLFTLKGNPAAGITALISSEVNQMTLLIGSMPLVFSASFGHASPFPLDPHQSIEFLLTASVSLFAIALLARMRIAWYGALVLLGLFIVHLPFTDSDARRVFALIYLGLAVVILVADRGRVVEMFRRARTVFKVESEA